MARSCEECERYFYGADGTCVSRYGVRATRPKGVPTPCDSCPKIPLELRKPGVNKHVATALTEGNRRCWEHYQESAATGWQTPDARDPLVRRHAALFASLKESAEVARSQALLGAVLTIKGAKSGE